LFLHTSQDGKNSYTELTFVISWNAFAAAIASVLMLNFSNIQIGKKYDRPWLAREWAFAGYEAISRGVFCPSGGGQIILFVTRIKQESLEQYNDYISGEYLFWEGEKGHGNDHRIADSTSSGEEIHLFFREIHHSPFEYKGLVKFMSLAAIPDTPTKFVFHLVHDQSAQDDVLMHRMEIENLAETERQSVIKARVGQGVFRQHLLEIWEGCAVTDVRLPIVLRASHIKPWRFSSNSERLNPYNGLLLLPQYDQLFDKGLISFNETGKVLRSPALDLIEPSKLGISPQDTLRSLSDQHHGFLQYHRDEVFVRFSE
jgi:putative restriction endonuclease